MEIQIQSLIDALKAQRNEALDAAAQQRARVIDLEAANGMLRNRLDELEGAGEPETDEPAAPDAAPAPVRSQPKRTTRASRAKETP